MDDARFHVIIQFGLEHIFVLSRHRSYSQAERKADVYRVGRDEAGLTEAVAIFVKETGNV